MAKQELAIPKAVEKELKMLRGFRDLAGERWGYYLGRKFIQVELTEKTEKERKAVAEARKAITGENLEEIITNGDIVTYKKGLKDIKDKREVFSKVAEPFREKMKPLRKAQNYIDSVAIPDALKELGKPVQRRFSLTKWVTEALEAEKANK